MMPYAVTECGVDWVPKAPTVRRVALIAFTLAAGAVLVWAGANLPREHVLSLIMLIPASAILINLAERYYPVYGWECIGLAIGMAAGSACVLPVAIILAPFTVLLSQLHTRPSVDQLIALLDRQILAAGAAAAVFAAAMAPGHTHIIRVVGLLAAMAAYQIPRNLLGLTGLPTMRTAFVRWYVVRQLEMMTLIATCTVLFHALIDVRPDLHGGMLLVLGITLWLAISLVDHFSTDRRSSVDNLLLMVGRRNPLFPKHADRIADYCQAIAAELGLPENQIREARLGGLLCDIGLDDELLTLVASDRPLTDEERIRLERHVESGVAQIARIPVLTRVATIVRAHHERWDGSGYPRGLAGHRIPLGSQIVAVADAFVALTSERAYRKLMSPAEALSTISAESGRQFSPAIVAALTTVLDRQLGSTVGADRPPEGERARTVQTLQGYLDHTDSRRLPWTQREALFGERERLLGALVALNELMGSITASLDEKEIITVAIGIARDLTGAAGGFALNREDGSVRVIHDRNGMPHQDMHYHMGELIDDGIDFSVPRLVPLASVRPEPMRDSLLKQGVDRLLVLPLTWGDRLLGVGVLPLTPNTSIDGSTMNLLLLVVAQVALALENARLHRETVERLREVSEMQALNESIIRDTAGGIIVIDLDGHVRQTSAHVTTMFAAVGHEIPEGIGWSYADWVATRGGGQSHLLTALREQREVHVYDAEMSGPLGVRYMNCHASPMRDATGAITHFICLFVDTTERHNLEQRAMQTEKLAALISLANGAANEIRNPLASIRGFVQLLQRADWTDPASPQAYLDIIISEVDRIDAVMKELLFLVRPVRSPRAPLRLPQLINDVCRLARPTAALKQVTVSDSYEGALEPLIGDEGALKQVFLNIITNAIEASPAGGRVALEARCLDHELSVSVTDTGCGIEPAQVRQLFDPFYTTKERGTGLGLFVAYAIARSHGGRIEVESIPGQGSTFTVILPAAVDQ